MTITKIYEEGQTAYLNQGVAVVFEQEPTLDSIDTARKLLDFVTDSLIETKLKEIS